MEVGDESEESEEEEDEKRPANAPLVKVKGVMQIQLSPEASARRCSSKGRGTIYNSVFGICCHFCRSAIVELFGLKDLQILMHLVCYKRHLFGKRHCVAKKIASAAVTLILMNHA